MPNDIFLNFHYHWESWELYGFPNFTFLKPTMFASDSRYVHKKAGIIKLVPVYMIVLTLGRIINYNKLKNWQDSLRCRMVRSLALHLWCIKCVSRSLYVEFVVNELESEAGSSRDSPVSAGLNFIARFLHYHFFPLTHHYG